MRVRNKATWCVIAAAFTGLAFMLQTTAALAETKILSGTVTYRERIALPPSARIEVKLVDASLADAPSKTIAEMARTVGSSGVPVAYELAFDAAEIQTGRSYALQARILVDGELWFTTTTRHYVLTGAADNPNIIVHRVGSTPTTPPTGRWLAEDIGGGGVVDRLQTVLEIAADGSISGFGGCNRMTGKAVISGNSITFGPIASTKMACTPAAMDQEKRFFATLNKARSWTVHAGMRKLALLDADGKPLATFAQM